ncbi:hypothetical protein FGB62_74g121 [Gracilaria domingensis]|nr:hypothetical protein FGB62_74g121 [Gracilaria domingensis]
MTRPRREPKRFAAVGAALTAAARRGGCTYFCARAPPAGAAAARRRASACARRSACPFARAVAPAGRQPPGCVRRDTVLQNLARTENFREEDGFVEVGIDLRL